mmetsp:Transcript_95160/g.148855  ORF Transcript_95160/g.148855 Transcript_95160/m.148855 type:complete len:423 (-) Transcript_95160:70-1338(-)
MARYSESPSPSNLPCEHRRRGTAHHEGYAGENGYDRRRTQTRSRSPQLAYDEPPREHRRRRHTSDAPRQRRTERLLQETREPLESDIAQRRGEVKPSERTQRRDRAGSDDGLEKSRGRRDRDRERDKRKMAEAQQMMMSGMMHPAAMQMAMMQYGGMMHPSYMAAMQQQQQKMMQKRDRRRRTKQTEAKQAEGGSGDESSSSSSSDSSGPENGVFGQAAAMAAMAAMQQQQQQQYHWPHPASASAPPPPQALRPPPQANRMSGLPPPPPPPPGHAGAPPDNSKEIEEYLQANPVEEDAADRLRALPPHLAAAVMARGPVNDSRDPTAVLLARLRAVEINRPLGEGPTPTAALASTSNDSSAPARRSVKSAIEKMIEDYRLSVGCAWTMRALAPDKQKLAAKIDPAGQADPSAYVAEELRKIV